VKSLNNEDNSLRSIKLGDILKPKEISEVMQFFKKNNLIGAKKYLNEPEMKKRLEDKGILPDYLYYNLELRFSN
jgi:hypothetical protein